MDTARRFFFVLCAFLVAYFFLRVLRSLGVEPELRGVWAGVAGYLTWDIVQRAKSSRRRRP